MEVELFLRSLEVHKRREGGGFLILEPIKNGLFHIDQLLILLVFHCSESVYSIV